MRAYLAYDANGAKTALERAEGQVAVLQREVATGDVNSAKATLTNLQESSADARAHSDGLMWKVGGKIPLVGQNFDAVSSVSRVLDTLASEGLPVVVNDRVDANTFKPKNGRIDIGAMEQLAPGVAALEKSVSAGLRELDGIESQNLIGPLREPYERLHAKLTATEKAASAGAKALSLMPSMLGGQDRRTYLLAVQNNAEIRSTGGHPGRFRVSPSEETASSLSVKQGSATDFGYFDPPAVKLTRSERGLYTKFMASFWADSTFTPDFPRTAEIMRAMVKEKFARSLDGVISVDPIALSYILKGTGPGEVEGRPVADQSRTPSNCS